MSPWRRDRILFGWLAAVMFCGAVAILVVAAHG